MPLFHMHITPPSHSRCTPLPPFTLRDITIYYHPSPLSWTYTLKDFSMNQGKEDPPWPSSSSIISPHHIFINCPHLFHQPLTPSYDYLSKLPTEDSIILLITTIVIYILFYLSFYENQNGLRTHSSHIFLLPLC